MKHAYIYPSTFVVVCVNEECGEPIPRPETGEEDWGSDELNMYETEGEALECPKCKTKQRIKDRDGYL